ncbi:protein of unknown function [Pararobbsia alpina]
MPAGMCGRRFDAMTSRALLRNRIHTFKFIKTIQYRQMCDILSVILDLPVYYDCTTL